MTVRTCPICGAPAEYVVESVIALALIDENGEYIGESNVMWDTQRPVLSDGRKTLGHGGHQWLVDSNPAKPEA
jgi:hypothetical protein